MVTPAKFLNVHAALRTRFRAHLLDRGFALLILRLLGLVATSAAVGLPGTVARETDLVLAVRTCSQLFATLVALAFIGGEI
jgi:hypothetical protein